MRQVRHKRFNIPTGWRQLIMAGHVAVRCFEWPSEWQPGYMEGDTTWWDRALYFSFSPGAPQALIDVCFALRDLSHVICQVCGAPTGTRVERGGSRILSYYTLCPAHLPTPIEGPDGAMWHYVRTAAPLGLKRLGQGVFPVLGTGLLWRDVVRAEPASFAMRLRSLAPYLDGPAALLVPWIVLAALERARPEAIRTLAPGYLLPLLMCPTAAVRERGLRLLEHLPASAAAPTTAAAEAAP